MSAPSDDLQRLVERIEAATGPDRELDCDVRLAVLGDCHYGVIHDSKYRAIGPAYLRGYVETYRHLLTSDDAIEDDIVPRYTDSIDAAMTLIPENDSRCWATGWTIGGGAFASVAFARSSYAATPALALASAALRARITQENSNG